MEPGLSAAGPPPALEKLVWHLLPPVVREEVAGDLWERFRSPLHYLADAVTTLPFLIVSQARRQTNGPLFLLQCYTVFVSLGGLEVASRMRIEPMGLRALIATVAALAALLLRAAYRPRDAWTGSRAFGDLIWILIAVLASQAITYLIDPFYCVRLGWLIAGLLLGLTMLLVLRSGTDLVTATVRMDAIDEDYQAFRSRVRVKNGLELGLFVPLLTIASWWATARASSFMVGVITLSWAGTTLAVLAVGLYRRPRAMPTALAPAGKLAFYRAHLARQRRLISFAWWWFFVPQFAAMGVNLVLRSVWAGYPMVAVSGAFGMAVLAVMIARANLDRRRQLGAKIEALDRLDRLIPT
jgi:hypothetical protein